MNIQYLNLILSGAMLSAMIYTLVLLVFTAVKNYKDEEWQLCKRLFTKLEIKEMAEVARKEFKDQVGEKEIVSDIHTIWGGVENNE